MSQFVPADRRIRHRSMPNVEAPRLLRRRMYLTRVIAHDRWNGSRHDFALRAWELKLIEDELERRGASTAASDASAW